VRIFGGGDVSFNNKRAGWMTPPFTIEWDVTVVPSVPDENLVSMTARMDSTSATTRLGAVTATAGVDGVGMTVRLRQ